MFCLKCGYPLQDLATHRCPECGERFDPLDESTYAKSAQKKQPCKRKYVNPAIMFIGLFIALSFVGIDLRLLPFYKLYSQVYLFITSYLNDLFLTFLGLSILGFGILNYFDMRTWIKVLLSMLSSVVLILLLLLLVIFGQGR